MEAVSSGDEAFAILPGPGGGGGGKSGILSPGNGTNQTEDETTRALFRAPGRLSLEERRRASSLDAVKEEEEAATTG